MFVAMTERRQKASAVSPLDRPVTCLPGVGPQRGKLLARLGIRTVLDLLLHRPRRYEDRSHVCKIAELSTEQPGVVRGTVIVMGVNRFPRSRKTVFELILDDGSGRLRCRWWNLPYMERYFRVGQELFVFGRLSSVNPRIMDHPETEPVEKSEDDFIHLNRLVPVYPLTEGVPQRWLRELIWRTAEALAGAARDLWPASAMNAVIADADADMIRTLSGLMREPGPASRPLSRAEAIRLLHCPDLLADAELARRRLALDEFYLLQLELRQRRLRFQTAARAHPCAGNNRLIKPFLARLPFPLTDAQKRVLRQIRLDMAGPHPMRRLLQGDVGSGKTVVAACAALMALESGFNVALMAPTEILAEQHFLTLAGWFAPLGVRVLLRTGSRRLSAGPDPEAPLFFAENSGTVPTVYVGTHALIADSVSIRNLGLVIIDEQHKFGVAQREKLVRKGQYPHVLVMTATPIPRTLALTLYGDLDVSVIDQLPPGRGRVRTFLRTEDALPKVWEFVRGELGKGRQAYVVYPRIEESADNVKAVKRQFRQLEQVLAPFAVGLLHGQLKPEQKESVMGAFRENRIQVLVTTSVIEVGLDVPNASVMVIENAEKFGLAQLHQLRGRIGRGPYESYCILICGGGGEDSLRRLQVLERTSNGFEIAEADLELRGPGDLLGIDQSGMPRFKFGDLRSDYQLIRLARALADATLRTGVGAGLKTRPPMQAMPADLAPANAAAVLGAPGAGHCGGQAVAGVPPQVQGAVTAGGVTPLQLT